jgi:glycosyltransferase involved in cell wall biosynthesis
MIPGANIVRGTFGVPAGSEQMIHYITTEGVGIPWVAIELEVMRRKGIPFALHSLRPPGQFVPDTAWNRELNKATRLIYPLPPAAFAWSVMGAPFLFGRRFFAALGNALFGERESARVRLASIAHVFVACHWARQLRRERVDLIHAQWIHSSGTVGMYGAWLLDVPFSFTGHAVDLFRSRAALKDKIRRADFIICISEFHREFYKRHGARDAQLHLVYCGIDARNIPVRQAPGGSVRPHIYSVGRLVEKKGFRDLIEACRLLVNEGLEFECTIAGRGPLEGELKRQISDLALDGSVSIATKPLSNEELFKSMAQADIFVLPCVWSKDGDADGTPRTLLEAMACGTPTVSTRLVGIPDYIEHEQSGLLVEPGNVDELAEALRRLIQDPVLADRLGRSGREQVLRKFPIEECLEPLANLFRERLGRPPRDEELRKALDVNDAKKRSENDTPLMRLEGKAARAGTSPGRLTEVDF